MGNLELAATVGFAFGMGMTTFFAPCAYPLLPGYVGYYVDAVSAESAGISSVLLRGGAAGVGVLLVYGLITAIITIVGRAILEELAVIEPIVGVALIVLGLLMLADRTPTIHIPLPHRRESIIGFGLFGGMYALAATGCTVPVFIALIAKAVTFPMSGRIAVLSSYALGVSLLMISATVLIAFGYQAGTERFPQYATKMKNLAGGIVVLAGVGQLTMSTTILA